MTSPSIAPTADSITVKETLDLLDGQFAPVANGVACGRYVFWLGSGLSRGSVPDLGGLVQKLLDFLQAHIDLNDPGCVHRRALESALDLAGLRDYERASVDFADPVASWDVVELVVKGLVKRYAELLDIRVAGQPEDYLLWEAVDVRATYPAGAPPDCEHLCFGILSLEGVIPHTASANWDGLIESALSELAVDPEPVLRVIVLATDFREPERRTRLLKLHGCASLAAHDPTKYRGALVATQSQITRWPHSRETTVMRDVLRTLATTKPTLMIGLSAQDSDIQDIFAAATGEMKWEWPSNPPAHVFAENGLGEKQRSLPCTAINTKNTERRSSKKHCYAPTRSPCSQRLSFTF
jgi:hypothetical protein